MGDLTVHRMGSAPCGSQASGIWGPPEDHDECIRVLRRAVELGVDFIDTANSYRPACCPRSSICEALYPYPEGLVIGTKAGLHRASARPADGHLWGAPSTCVEECLMSLRRLRLECIDLFQLHRIDTEVPAAEQFGVCKAAGADAGQGTSRRPVRGDRGPDRGRHEVVPSCRSRTCTTWATDGPSRCSGTVRDRGVRLHPVVPDRRRHAGGRARHRGDVAKAVDATGAQVALAWLLATLAGHASHPGHLEGRRSGENCARSGGDALRRQFDGLSRSGGMTHRSHAGIELTIGSSACRGP